MRTILGFVVVVGFLGTGCSNSQGTGPANPTPVDPTKVSVQMTSATLGEDCGGAGVPTPQPKAAAPASPAREAARPHRGVAAEAMSESRMKAPCQQTSIQFSVIAPTGVAATDLRIKKVEIFDEKGKRVGELTPRSPMVWTNGAYQTWDETVAAGQSLSVSYSLSQPDFSSVSDAYNKTYVVKVVMTVGGSDQPLQRDVYLQGETMLPPGVVT